MQKTKIFFILISLFISGSTFAQNQIIDQVVAIVGAVDVRTQTAAVVDATDVAHRVAVAQVGGR